MTNKRKQSEQPQTEGIMRVFQQLNPSDQDIIGKMIETLAEREGIRVDAATTSGLKTPMEGIMLWETKLNQERYSPRTAELYVRCVTNILKRDPNPTTLSIRSYLAERLRSKSSSIVASELKGLRSFFTFLYSEGLWLNNPIANVRSVVATYGKRECPEPETIMAILKSKPSHRNHIMKFRMMTVLLVGTALRVSEAAGVERANIDLKNLEVTVIGKGRKRRTVPVDGMVAGMLAHYMEQNPTKTIYLFPAETGNGIWDVHSYEKTLKRVCKKMGVPHTTPHQLRHFYATYALKHGAKIEVVSKILGHASVAITLDIYRHVGMKEVHETHDTFSPFSQMQKQLPETSTKTEEEVVEGEFTEVKEDK